MTTTARSGEERPPLTVIGLGAMGSALADAAGWARKHGADYLDGAIMADPENIGTSQTSALQRIAACLRGPRDDAETARLQHYLGPDPGIAALHFMALIGLGYETWIGYLRTLALVAAERVDATAFAPFATGMFEASHDLLTAMARAVDTGQHPPAAGPLSVHAALMDDLIQTRQARGIDAETLKEVKDLIDRRVADGRGADGFSSIIETIRPLAARPSADGPKSA